MQVMGECRGGEPKLLLQPADGKARIARADERPMTWSRVGLPRASSCLAALFDFHGNRDNLSCVGRQQIFPQFSK